MSTFRPKAFEMPKPPKLARTRKAPVVQHGPRVFAPTTEPERLGPPGEPPPGFVTAKTSATEWPPYWGLAQIFGFPLAKNVRRPPFEGGLPFWTYQAYVDAQAASATNIDFVIWQPFREGTPIALRIQTEFFHNFASAATQAYDLTHRERLQGGFEVVDIYDFDYMRDKTGQAIIVLLKRAMGLIEPGTPQRSGRIQRL